jgi:hypothetical protein
MATSVRERVGDRANRFRLALPMQSGISYARGCHPWNGTSVIAPRLHLPRRARLAKRAAVRLDESWRYNKRGTAEQWIKEGKQAVKMIRLFCHRFRSNEVRLALSLVGASDLGRSRTGKKRPARSASRFAESSSSSGLYYRLAGVDARRSWVPGDDHGRRLSSRGELRRDQVSSRFFFYSFGSYTAVQEIVTVTWS